MNRRAVVVATAWILGFSGMANAGKPDTGSIVFGKKKALWTVPAASPTDSPVKVASLGFSARRLVSIVASSDGDSLLVSTEKNHYWVARSQQGGSEVPVVRHVCRGTAVMSTNGKTVVCRAKDGVISIEDTESAVRMETNVQGKKATFAGAKGRSVVVVTPAGIESVLASDPKKRKLLTSLKPASNLLVAPNGKRAVAVYEEGDGTALYVFVLNGESKTKRKLGTDSVPVGWSRDSKWLVVTRKKRGCVLRASGGQYRCFDGYRALGISPRAREALLVNGKRTNLTIHRADLGGAHSSKPTVLLTGAQGAAAWLAD